MIDGDDYVEQDMVRFCELHRKINLFILLVGCFRVLFYIGSELQAARNRCIDYSGFVTICKTLKQPLLVLQF